MKWILHDWTDEKCVKILKNCWRALPEKGKVILIEMVTPEEPRGGDVRSNITFDFDMLMLSQCSGGKERTKAEFQDLALASGFTRCHFMSCASPYWVIEFHKAEATP
ncbi:PREDICTED: indole glucosinolate O-methyltransferase 4-like [Tarenaya hassleriana]|nr:PREDICTED: indole glucosinolate O-methyltransferase 4-like [Tarenaya hassleriana]